jgi:hypothetical protein
MESHKHHFVPKLLLRPWLREGPGGQLNLWGYHWDHRRAQLACKRRGLDAFCFQIDLLTLQAHALELVERTNTSSAAQAEKFVFSIDSDSEEWLSGYLASSKPVK